MERQGRSGRSRRTRQAAKVIAESESVGLAAIMDGSFDDPLDHMRQRIEMCRRLAKTINDAEAARVLREMADQGEIDLKKLLAERDAKG
jgi:hypothetical protein